MSVHSTELIDYCLHIIGTAFSVHYTEYEGAHILESYKVEPWRKVVHCYVNPMYMLDFFLPILQSGEAERGNV